jgi:hypothetical protein
MMTCTTIRAAHQPLSSKIKVGPLGFSIETVGRTPDELLAAVPHMLGFTLSWTELCALPG